MYITDKLNEQTHLFEPPANLIFLSIVLIFLYVLKSNTTKDYFYLHHG